MDLKANVLKSAGEASLPKKAKVIHVGDLTLGFSSSLKEMPFGRKFNSQLEEGLEIFQSFLNQLYKKELGLKKLPTEFHVTLVGDQKMRSLNKDFRGKDKTTDVLSFPVFDNIRGGDEFLMGAVELGDIFISYPVLRKQAKEFKISEENEFFHLLIHGFLHLLGFDHEISEKEEVIMENHEKKLVDKLVKKIF